MSQNTSIANAVGNPVYTDLVLTRFPQSFDERDGAKNNVNLNRFTNLQDYNMAEHVNALQDATMAIQRSLGELVNVPSGARDANGNLITRPEDQLDLARTYTVNQRLNDIEQFDWFNVFDRRYGGPSWRFDPQATTNPTIQQHRHNGSGNGMPERIMLTSEVQGELPRTNINLSRTANGLTGEHIFVSVSNAETIAQSLNDKISERTGGSIQSNATLNIQGKVQTRWQKEYDSSDGSGTEVSNSSTLIGRVRQSHATAMTTLLQRNITDLHHGRYVLAVRLRASARNAQPAVVLEARNTANNTLINSIQLSGNDFDVANQFKMVYLIFDNPGNLQITVRKLTTSSANVIEYDHAIITPIHPAVFDR